ncbi:hypothetical protein KP005_17950 [Geomonas nitrogeniifigens]|uniref:Uncharacterized protein n=1 Tax=Geomonas diazotrophica TaxID=2843197 RepID=A0ABX8JJ60_9BACT|nr:hypothetical protein [Geomonas nitrogeniifigens]QWV97201.1 hypothetical protein KP005_17950 [Geomonas nitrogeniifigens]
MRDRNFPIIEIPSGSARLLNGNLKTQEQQVVIVTDDGQTEQCRFVPKQQTVLSELDDRREYKIGGVVFNADDSLNYIQNTLWTEDGDAFLIRNAENEYGIFFRDSISKLFSGIDKVWCSNCESYHQPPKCLI